VVTKSETGKLGEDIACEYLVNRGFIIIERNFRKPWGELDIIAKDSKGVLVFVEVKAIRQTHGKQFGNNSAIAELPSILPEENLTAAKLRKLKRTASLYVGFNQEKVDDEKGWRIDLVAITIPDLVEGLTDSLKYCGINHLENI